MLTIGFAGAGVIAWAHAMSLQAMIRGGSIDARVVAVHDTDAARAAGFAAANGASSVPSTAEVLDLCDALWVCTPTVAHRHAVEEAVARGKAVFCEKPLARNLEDAEELARVVLAGGVRAQVGLVLRHAPVFVTLKDLLSSGELGTPMAAVLRDDQYFPVQGLYNSTWRADVDVAGGGCLIEHSIHDLDILRFCLGEVVRISGRTANFAGHVGVEDVATCSMVFESGASAEVVSVWHSVLTRGSSRRLEVFCERAMVWLENDFIGPIHVETNDGAEVRPCPPPVWVQELPLPNDDVGLAIRAYVEADRAFMDAVSEGHQPEPSFTEALIAHRLVDAAYRSASGGGETIDLRG